VLGWVWRVIREAILAGEAVHSTDQRLWKEAYLYLFVGVRFFYSGEKLRVSEMRRRGVGDGEYFPF
jgi:hypothetical protein